MNNDNYTGTTQIPTEDPDQTTVTLYEQEPHTGSDIDVYKLVADVMRPPSVKVRKPEPDRYSIAAMPLKERNKILEARKARTKCQLKKKR